MATADTTEKWTRDEIIEGVSVVAQKRLGMNLEQFVVAVQSEELDRCEYAELIALLNLLSPNDPIFKAAKSKAC